MPLLSREQYIDLVLDFVELLDPKIVIHRLSAETYREITVAPEWSVDKRGVHNAIVKALTRRDTWQGKHFVGDAVTNLARTCDACSQVAAL